MKKGNETPQRYRPLLGFKETQKGIRLIKDYFQAGLGKELNLLRVTAPMVVRGGKGINDDLNGVEQPVAFTVAGDNGARVEIVQSLAKWKRMVLADYGFKPGEGLYTDMNALRPDETLDHLHSIYVDQWDWELSIIREDRSLEFLKWAVKRIYRVMKRAEKRICLLYPVIQPTLPAEITFIHSEDLLDRFPGLTPKEREREACREYGAVFVIGIGAPLKDGKPHDFRAPDYDDWSSHTKPGYHGLNGDILVWNPVAQNALEISSMGIRVDDEALVRQLEMTGTTARKQLWWHQRLLNGDLPLSIGGGIGQSRLCMFFLRKAHIGEVQSSIWPEKMVQECRKDGVLLL